MFSAGGWGAVPEDLKHLPKIRASSIGDFLESPAHYESFHVLREREATAAMEMGTAIHMAVLEPEKFDATYVEDLVQAENHLKTADDIKAVLKELGLKISGTKPELIERLTESGDERVALLYDNLRAAHISGREVLSVKEMKACLRIRQRISEDPEMNYLLSGGGAERLGWVLHQNTQQIISFRIDYFRPFEKNWNGFGGVAIDVKKFRDIEPRKFERAVANSRVHVQGAIYVDALNALTGYRNMYQWIAVNDQAPYLCAAYKANDAMLEVGQQLYVKALEGIQYCRDYNNWPGYTTGITEIGLPAWAMSGDYEGGGI